MHPRSRCPSRRNEKWRCSNFDPLKSRIAVRQGRRLAETIDVDTERTGVRTYVARGFTRSGRGLEWSRKRLAFYHDPLFR